MAEFLFADWLAKLSIEKFSFTSQSGPGFNGQTGIHTYTYGNTNSPHFILDYDQPTGDWTLKTIQSIAKKDVTKLIDGAIKKLIAKDFGEILVYQTTMKTEGVKMGPSMQLHFPRLIGDKRRCLGSFKLGDDILLEFKENCTNPIADALFASPAEIDLTLFIHAPIASTLAQRIAAGITETVAAICALTLERVVEFSWNMFPADEKSTEAATKKRLNTTVKELSYDGSLLNIFARAGSKSRDERLDRARGWLLSYHSALQQTNPDVVTILIVAALESLIRSASQKDKDALTKHFRETLKELCPGTIDEILGHQNLEWAFGYKKQNDTLDASRDQFLNKVYDLRSIPVHEGIRLSGAGLFVGSEPSGMRVYLLCKLARGAFLKFLDQS